MNETCPKYSGVTAKAGEARSCQVTVNEMGIQIILVATAKMPVSQKKCLTLLSGGSYGSFCRSRLWWWMFQIEKGTQRLEPVSLVKLWEYSREFECNGRGRSAFGRCPKIERNGWKNRSSCVWEFIQNWMQRLKLYRAGQLVNARNNAKVILWNTEFNISIIC